METTEIIGALILAVSLLVGTSGIAFAYGYDCGERAERVRGDKRGDRRVQGVLKSVNESRPSRRLTYRKVNPRIVGAPRYLNSKLPGEVVA